MVRRIAFILVPLLALVACKGGGNDSPQADNILITSDVVTESFTGNGVQWGGYDILKIWTGSATLTEEDWNTLFTRVRFMRPPIVRLMTDAGWNYMTDGTFNPQKSNDILVRILDFCQAEGITVIIGEWGHKGGSTIDQTWLENSASFLEWLLVTKSYTCIKYYNMVNEPNGSWSSIAGNYTLWADLIEQFSSKLADKGIGPEITITGPDIAVWNTGLLSWITNTNYDLGQKIGAYDIHTYPTEAEVRSGDYSRMIKAYREEAPATKEMIMSEFGFKYSASSALGIENEAREDNDPFASDDSNMMTYDAFYAVDVADAIMQIMQAGYSGTILWDMDDAMYNINGGTSTLLKRWGFWNILGEEKFNNPADEDIRPWFYTASLMSRYFPAGTTIFNISLPDKKGLRAVAGVRDDRYTIAVVNSNYVDYTLTLSMEDGTILNPLKCYKYVSGDGSNFTGRTDANGFALPEEEDVTLDFSGDKKIPLEMKAQSFIMFTNME